MSFTLLFVAEFGDKATTSASPSRVLDFQDGVALLFQVLFHGSALFGVSICNSGSISSFLIFSLPADHSCSEIGKKKHEEDLKQTRRDRPIFKKKVGNYDKCEFSNFFLFQRAKMIISVLVTWMIVDCNLAVRFLLSF